MSGCFGNSSEDRARERELNRYLDACAMDDKQEQRYEDALDDIALECLEDSGYLYDVFDSNVDAFMAALAQFFKASDNIRLADVLTIRNSNFMELRDKLAILAKELPSIQQLAHTQVENEQEDAA